MTITPIVDETRRIAHFIAIKNDITEKKRSRELLESSLREKEVLLREVHHRVKNNMQVVSSLITLSAEGLDDEKSSFSVRELSRRIEAMAIIHEQFYQADDLASIDFSLYLKQLIDNLIEDAKVEPGTPEIVYDPKTLMMTLEAAIPAGLIASELVSNALACIRAVPERAGVIAIKLNRDEGGTIVLEVRDNGPGLPEGFDMSRAHSLGMQLIGVLAEQLGGSIQMHTDGGTAAILTFTPRA
jgi:two-component sensor histidine kinase